MFKNKRLLIEEIETLKDENSKFRSTINDLTKELDQYRKNFSDAEFDIENENVKLIYFDDISKRIRICIYKDESPTDDLTISFPASVEAYEKLLKRFRQKLKIEN